MPPWHDALELSEECWQLAKHSSTKYCKNWAAYECRCKCMNPHVCNTCFFFFITSYYIFTQKKNSVKTPKSKQFVHVHAKNHAKLSCSIFLLILISLRRCLLNWPSAILSCCHQWAVPPSCCGSSSAARLCLSFPKCSSRVPCFIWSSICRQSGCSGVFNAVCVKMWKCLGHVTGPKLIPL